METLAKNGIYTGMTLMPLLPFINDTKSNLKDLIQRAKDSGASYIIPMFGVTLRAGSREFLYRAFNTNFKGMTEKYETHFGNQYMCTSPDYPMLRNFFIHQMKTAKLSSKMNFYSPPQNVDQQLSLF